MVFITVLILKIFDQEKLPVVKINASDQTTGSTLSQIYNNGELYLIIYFSAKYLTVKYNYDIYNKELLAIIKALEEQNPELGGAQIPFEVLTDYKNLKIFIINK